jgi:hypothetical protein
VVLEPPQQVPSAPCNEQVQRVRIALAVVSRKRAAAVVLRAQMASVQPVQWAQTRRRVLAVLAMLDRVAPVALVCRLV